MHFSPQIESSKPKSRSRAADRAACFARFGRESGLRPAIFLTAVLLVPTSLQPGIRARFGCESERARSRTRSRTSRTARTPARTKAALTPKSGSNLLAGGFEVGADGPAVELFEGVDGFGGGFGLR